MTEPSSSPAAGDSQDWRPTASLDTLRARARLLARARAFLSERGLLEVETPILGRGGSTDPHLVSLQTQASTPSGARRLWCQTSPEHHMKRLLAAGSGPIFQIARCFRDGETGSRHNIEFSMLEWYRPGWALGDLLEETAALVHALMAGGHQPPLPPAITRHRYKDLFIDALGLDPLTATDQALAECARQHTGTLPAGVAASRDACLDLLMGLVIEPGLGHHGLAAVVEYPASQAALARQHHDAQGQRVASRFELYCQGVELANGYDELTDPSEQHRRLIMDNHERRQAGKAEVDIDHALLSALAHGMPSGAGVALGIDRVIQLSLGKASLQEVLSFSSHNC